MISISGEEEKGSEKDVLDSDTLTAIGHFKRNARITFVPQNHHVTKATLYILNEMYRISLPVLPLKENGRDQVRASL